MLSALTVSVPVVPCEAAGTSDSPAPVTLVPLHSPELCTLRMLTTWTAWSPPRVVRSQLKVSGSLPQAAAPTKICGVLVVVVVVVVVAWGLVREKVEVVCARAASGQSTRAQATRAFRMSRSLIARKGPPVRQPIHAQATG